MKKLLTIITILSLLTLTACGPKEVEPEKKSFYIKVENISNFGNTVSIEKPGKLGGTQEITVTSQLNARVKNIPYKEGNHVRGGQPIIILSDDIANYNSMVQRAKTALDNAIINYEQTKNNLNSAISSAKTLLSQAEKNFESSQDSAEQSIRQANQVVENTSLTKGSTTSLNIETIITNIENQITSIKSNFTIQKNNLIGHIDDVLYQTDSILGVTKDYKDNNDSFEIYLGAKDSRQKFATENIIRELYKQKDFIEKIPTEDITNEQIITTLPIFKSSYNKTADLLKEMHTLLKNSIVSTTFPQTQINGYINIMDGLETANQAKYAAFVGFETQVNSFLGDIKFDPNMSEEDLVKNIAQQQILIAIKNAKEAQKTADIAYQSTLIGTETSIFNAEANLKNAKINYDNQTNNEDNQLNLLKNQITQAKIAYEDALTTYNKLSVRSPIRGTIGNIFVDQGQEVKPGVPLFTVVSDKDQSIEIYVTNEEHELISNDQKVAVMYNDKVLNGKISSISSVAGPNTLYKAKIELNQNAELIGDIATVHIPVKLEKVALPINAVTALQNGKGFIYLLSGNQENSGSILEPIKTFIDLGQTRNDRIEIASPLPIDAKIITSDISNYNRERFEMVMRE